MIRYAAPEDIGELSALDRHVSQTELMSCINLHRVIVCTENGLLSGLLRYSMFWDNIPFMNMLFIVEEERGKGYGSRLADFWESEMRCAGHRLVLTSTQSDERGQLFFRGRGYVDCGSLILPGEVTELIMYKKTEDENG